MARSVRASSPVSSVGRLIPRARRPLEEVVPLAVGKISPPTPAFPVLERPRLFRILGSATHNRITVVDAPAGTGKTLALSSWVPHSPQVAWVTVDRNDNEPRAFWRYVVEAIRRVAPTPAAALAGADVAEERFAEHFCEAIDHADQRIILVLDQAHEILDPRVLGQLQLVMERAPRKLGLVLSGRGMPGVGLARLRVAGEVSEIGSSDLAATRGEAREFLALCGIELAEAELDLLLRRTGGWMAGLRLAALWWHAQPSHLRDLSRFTGDDPLVADYLGSEVVGEAERGLLLRTSIVDRVSVDLARTLTGDSASTRMLEHLERVNPLVAPVDRPHNWYEYRPILREYLLHRLQRELPDEVRELRRRASRWLAEAGQFVAAARSAGRAGDWHWAGELLAGHGERILAGSTAEGRDELASLLAEFPVEEIRANPDLAAVCAAWHLDAADVDTAETFVRMMEAHAPASSLEFAKIVELRLRIACHHGRIPSELVEQAQKLLDSGVQHGAQLAGLSYWLGIGLLWCGRPMSAKRALEQALPLVTETGCGGWARSARGWLAVLHAVAGELGRSERHMAAKQDEKADMSTTLLYDVARVVADIERDRLDHAVARLDRMRRDLEGRPVAFHPAEPPIQELLGVLGARIRKYRGDLAGARAELKATRDRAGRIRQHVIDQCALLDAEICLAEGNPSQGRVVLAQRSDAARTFAEHQVVEARLRLAEGDPAAALEAVTPCLSGAAAETRMLDKIAASLVAATAQRRLGSQAAVTKLLEQALATARGEGLVRVFLDAGRSTRAMLTVGISPDGPHAEFRSSLLHRFDVQPTMAWKSSDPAVRLTASERAVLRYLPSHLTNEEIARDLCLSVNTVKSHLRTLYRKLGVNSRREAIARAMQHDLLR